MQCNDSNLDSDGGDQVDNHSAASSAASSIASSTATLVNSEEFAQENNMAEVSDHQLVLVHLYSTRCHSMCFNEFHYVSKYMVEGIYHECLEVIKARKYLNRKCLTCIILLYTLISLTVLKFGVILQTHS